MFIAYAFASLSPQIHCSIKHKAAKDNNSVQVLYLQKIRSCFGQSPQLHQVSEVQVLQTLRSLSFRGFRVESPLELLDVGAPNRWSKGTLCCKAIKVKDYTCVLSASLILLTTTPLSTLCAVLCVIPVCMYANHYIRGVLVA